MLVGTGLEVPWFLWRQVDLTTPKRNAAGKHLEFPLTITFRACSKQYWLGLFSWCPPAFSPCFHKVVPNWKELAILPQWRLFCCFCRGCSSPSLTSILDAPAPSNSPPPASENAPFLPPHFFLTYLHLFALQLRLQMFLMLQSFLIIQIQMWNQAKVRSTNIYHQAGLNILKTSLGCTYQRTQNLVNLYVLKEESCS